MKSRMRRKSAAAAALQTKKHEQAVVFATKRRHDSRRWSSWIVSSRLDCQTVAPTNTDLDCTRTTSRVRRRYQQKVGCRRRSSSIASASASCSSSSTNRSRTTTTSSRCRQSTEVTATWPATSARTPAAGCQLDWCIGWEVAAPAIGVVAAHWSRTACRATSRPPSNSASSWAPSACVSCPTSSVSSWSPSVASASTNALWPPSRGSVTSTRRSIRFSIRSVTSSFASASDACSPVFSASEPQGERLWH